MIYVNYVLAYTAKIVKLEFDIFSSLDPANIS
jgi:hypothetical protein